MIACKKNTGPGKATIKPYVYYIPIFYFERYVNKRCYDNDIMQIIRLENRDTLIFHTFLINAFSVRPELRATVGHARILVGLFPWDNKNHAFPLLQRLVERP